MTNSKDDIRLELESISTAVANLPSGMPFAVPEGYFERLPEQVLSLVQRDGAKSELEELSPLLAGIRDKQPFSIPEGYFDSIQPSKFATQTHEGGRKAGAGPAIVRSMPLRTLMVRMAAAASVIGLIALTAWLMTDRPGIAPGAETVQVTGQMQKQHSDDTLAVSDEALAGFLLEDVIMPVEITLPATDLSESGDLAILDLDESSIQDLLKDIPDDALETYVAQNPGSDGSVNMN